MIEADKRIKINYAIVILIHLLKEDLNDLFDTLFHFMPPIGL